MKNSSACSRTWTARASARNSTSPTRSAAWCAIALSAALLSGCGHERDIEAKIRAQLKDPESARFTSLKTSKDGAVACGFVNAKNSFGGYTGDRFFLVYGGQTRYAEEEGDAMRMMDCCYAAMAQADGRTPDPDGARMCGTMNPAFKLPGT